MSKKFIYKAPAKVNLFLQIKNKRPDGFHELETLFEALSLHDVLTFIPIKEGIKISSNIKSLPSGPSNLCYKAAILLKERHNIDSGISIHIKKNIPVAAGLGGGSSDAATTLLALNEIWNLKIPQSKLMKYAAEFGSDNSFFVLNTPYAWGRGRGERLSAIPSKLKLWHVLVTPRLHVLAGDIYKSLRPDLLTRGKVGARMLKPAVLSKDYQKLNNSLFNTLEAVLLEKYKIIRTLKEDLILAGAESAMVSGSGPTVFGLTKSKEKADSIARKLKKKHPTKFISVTSTLV